VGDLAAFTRLVKTPKLYMLDTGLVAYLTGWSTAETLAAGAMAGAVFETHVIVEILKSWLHRAREPMRRLPHPLAAAAVVCLAPSLVPIDAQTVAVPVGAL
jgi:hypothetical protein